MNSIRSSLVFSFLENYGNLIVNIVTVIFLAHLLTPVETGLYSVAAALVNLAQTVREFGASAYILQEKELTREKLASVTGVCLLIAAMLALIFLCSAQSIAQFYGNERLAPIIYVLCLNFILVGYSSIGLALLRRDMRFRASAFINLTSATTGSLVAIVLAALGFGAISLAWASLANVLITVTGNTASLGFKCLVWPSLRHWREQANFGIYTTGSSVLALASDRAPDLVVARLISLEGVGLFSRGNGLITLFRTAIFSAVDPVIRSAIAAIHRERGEISGPVLATFNNLCAVAWPALAVMAVLAHPIIIIMFGEKWEASVSVAQILCAGAAISLIGNICAQCLFAIGAVRANFIAQAVSAPISIAGVAIGSLWGLNGAAVGYGGTTVILALISLTLLRQRAGMAWHAIARSMFPGLMVAALTAVPPLAVGMLLGFKGVNELGHAVLAGIGAGAAWLAALHGLRHPLCLELRPAENWLRGRARKLLGWAP